MYKRNAFYHALLILLGMVLLGEAVHAATITLRVGSVRASPGSTVEVPIEAVGAPGIGPLQMELVYDPAVLTAETVTHGALLSSNALMESNVTPRGRVIVAIVAADPIKGDGVIVKVRFKVIGNAGQQSALTLEAVQAWERGNQREVLVKTEAGRVTVGGADLLAWILSGATCLFILLLVGGGGVWLLTRRKRPAPAPYAYPQPYTPPPPPPAAPRPDSSPARTPAPEWTCPRCGAANRADARFCSYCGQRIRRN